MADGFIRRYCLSDFDGERRKVNAWNENWAGASIHKKAHALDDASTSGDLESKRWSLEVNIVPFRIGVIVSISQGIATRILHLPHLTAVVHDS